MKKYGFQIVFVWIFGVIPVFAQDYHLSQTDGAPLYLNPALTAVQGFEQRFSALYRSQWGKVLTNPYVTTHLGYDRPKDRFGTGGFIMHNKAGIGGFSTLSVIASGSYEITTDPKLYRHLFVGLQLGMLNKNFNPDKYSWENQYTIENGGGFNQSLPVGESFEKQSVWLPQANLGVYFMNNNNQRFFHYFAGFALLNGLSPKETFLGSNNHLPRRWLVHGGFRIFANEKITVQPQWLWMYQSNNTELKFDLIGFYKIDAKKMVIFGPSYRNKDAAVLIAGMVYDEYTVRISYDINTSSLKTYSKSQGGVEVSFIWTKPLEIRKPSIE
ncbi:MAG: PorP/SprF family type IX secretion system membrane protein [Bacteroidetes bacterium]|nr:PorP/SprF family type IX secretion system membrane protein [Bacteroidota bacterium]